MAAGTYPINCGDISQSNPGTGDFVLQGTAPAALAANLRVGKIVLATGAVLEYLAVDNADKSKWEVGSGTYTTGAFHLTRTVKNSSNSDALVNFTGTCNIYFTILPDAIAQTDPLGALSCNVNQPIPTSIVDWATNGTNTVYVTGTGKIFVTTVAGSNIDWTGYELAIGSGGFTSICRWAGVGYIAINPAASGSFQIFVNAAEDGLSWVNINVSLPFIPACVRTDGTTLVVVGSSVAYPVGGTAAGSWWTTTDTTLQSWTKQTSNAGANNINWLSWNATSGVWWAVGAAGTLLSSTNGTAVAARTSNAGSVNLVRVEQTPNGTTGAMAISASGNIVYTAAPGTVGTAWTNVAATAGNTGSAGAWTGLCLSNSVYLVLSSSGTGIYSTNFSSWAKFGGGSINAVQFANSKYVCAGGSGLLNGVSLNALTPVADAQLDATWNALTYLPTNTRTVVVGNAGLMSTSDDGGATWTSRTSGFGSSNILAAVYDATAVTGLEAVIVGAGGKIGTSIVGAVWVSQTSGTSNQLNAVCFGTGLTNPLLACGESGTIVTSVAGGATWTVRTSGVTQSLKGCASNGTNYVVVGTNCILHSTDGGVTWVVQDLMTNGIGTPSITFQSICYDGTRFVATSSTGFTFWSTAGTGSWTLKGISESANATTSANAFFTNNTYVTTGSTGFIASSSNCIAWSIQRTAFTWGGSGRAGFIGSNFYIFGTSGYYSSSAGLAWSSYLGGNVNAATSVSGHLAAINQNGTLITSTDGASYSLIANQLPAGTFVNGVASMASDGTNMVAVSANAVYRSADNGTTWTQVASAPVLGTFIGVPACAYGNGYFIVTGILGYWIYSSDGGATWTAGTRVSHSFQSICYDAVIAKFIGICTNGVIVTGTGTSFTANNGLVTAGSPIGTGARIATDGNGNVVVCDPGPGIAQQQVMYLTTDGSTFKQIVSPVYGISANPIVCLNGIYFGLSPSSANSVAYTSDRSTWFGRAFSASANGIQWAIYFNSKYIFFSSGNIAVLQ